MTIDEMIAVLQAAKAGREIQFAVRENQSAEWYPWLGDPSHVWNFGTCDYRVKPEPRRVWINDPGGNTWYRDEDAAWRSAASCARQIEFVEVLK